MTNESFGDLLNKLLDFVGETRDRPYLFSPYEFRYQLERLREAHRREVCDLLATIAAERKEKAAAAELINTMLDDLPLMPEAHDWLIRNGFKDESYQAATWETSGDTQND